MGRAVARALETGQCDGIAARVLASAWAPLAAWGLARPAVVPPRIAVVCVGGATLGGSGKTRVAIACARELASAGARVAVIGHAYRAAPRVARVVSVDDALSEVGDEALVCAYALAETGARVVVGPTRQLAIDHALRSAPDVLVLDGPLDVRGPEGSTTRVLSLLAVDAERPWGSGRLPPAGDLRAPREALVARADHVVPVDATPSSVRWRVDHGRRGRREEGQALPLASLREGDASAYRLYTALARPDRLIRALRASGVALEAVVSSPDHGPVAPLRLPERSEAPWLATEKCALHLEGVPLDAPLGVLASDLELPAPVRSALRTLN